MRRGFLVISILMMSSCFLAAGGRGRSMDAPRFTYGIKWSYIGTFFNHFHHNYITSDGYRENEQDSYFSYRNNAQILLNAGCNIGKRFNLSIYAGYGGLYGTKVFPVSLRGTYYITKDITHPHWLTYMDLGCGLENFKKMPGWTGKAGAGYRIPLSRSVKLDFLLSYQCAYADIPFSDADGEYLPAQNIRRNDNFLSSFLVGIGIMF